MAENHQKLARRHGIDYKFLLSKQKIKIRNGHEIEGKATKCGMFAKSPKRIFQKTSSTVAYAAETSSERKRRKVTMGFGSRGITGPLARAV